MYATNFDSLIESMKSTQQTTGVSVLDHGHRVHQRYGELVQELNQGIALPGIQSVWERIRERLVSLGEMERYQVYHDCGKPACASDGHFPDHAEHSANQWALLFPEDVTVADLMRLDMQFHLMNAEDAKAFWPHPLAPTLFVTAWAEILANAEMFGGQESTSFKMKRKRLERAGRAL